MTQPQLALIVEDSPTHRMMLKSILEKLDIKTLEAEDGQQAAEIFSQHPVDIVFMDIMMPVMDGFEATRQIRASAKGQQVKIIMVTALDGEDNVSKGLQAGADLYITKPYRANEIMSVLTED